MPYVKLTKAKKIRVFMQKTRLLEQLEGLTKIPMKLYHAIASQKENKATEKDERRGFFGRILHAC